MQESASTTRTHDARPRLPSQRPPLPADPGAEPGPRPHPAGDEPADDRPPRPEFGALGKQVLAGVRKVFQTRHPVVIYASSGTGAWEGALVNTLSPGDAVLMVETGHFAALWQRMAARLGLAPEILCAPGPDALLPEAPHWRQPARPEQIEERLRRDREKKIKAVCVVHNETSTGALSDIAAVRKAIDAAGHPALLLVDSISGLACADLRTTSGASTSPSAARKKG
jgi:alanine-glyoxylate transaminase/serine-glyoxylate transaminase/serine-pyruvate transaminase